VLAAVLAVLAARWTSAVAQQVLAVLAAVLC
jgi:hypothetical protein